jgi:hypothetical protein
VASGHSPDSHPHLSLDDLLIHVADLWQGVLLGLPGFPSWSDGAQRPTEQMLRTVGNGKAGCRHNLRRTCFVSRERHSRVWGDVLGGELVAGGEFTAIQADGFILEMLGLLLLLVGSMILGVTYLRANVLPRLLAWLLILAGPGGVLLSALHAPSKTMLPFCFAWVALGSGWTNSRSE